MNTNERRLRPFGLSLFRFIFIHQVGMKLTALNLGPERSWERRGIVLSWNFGLSSCCAGWRRVNFVQRCITLFKGFSPSGCGAV